MLREIIRARMAREGVELAGFVFRTSKPSYAVRAAAHAVRSGSHSDTASDPCDLAGASWRRGSSRGESPRAKRAVPHADLAPEERAAVDAAVAGLDDDRLAEALKNAITASLEWKKGL